MIEPVVIDNFFPENVLQKIDNFYKTAPLKLSGTEHENTSTFLQCSIGTEELLGVFELDQHIDKHLNDKKLSFRNLERFYINILTNAEDKKLKGHKDMPEDSLKNNELYIVCLIFLNPEGNKDTGIHINDDYYEDVYNRLIIFSGTDWHKPEVPKDNYVRITLYANFSNRVSKHNVFRQIKNADKCSKILKNVYRK